MPSDEIFPLAGRCRTNEFIVVFSEDCSHNIHRFKYYALFSDGIFQGGVIAVPENREIVFNSLIPVQTSGTIAMGSLNMTVPASSQSDFSLQSYTAITAEWRFLLPAAPHRPKKESDSSFSIRRGRNKGA